MLTFEVVAAQLMIGFQMTYNRFNHAASAQLFFDSAMHTSSLSRFEHAVFGLIIMASITFVYINSLRLYSDRLLIVIQHWFEGVTVIRFVM